MVTKDNGTKGSETSVQTIEASKIFQTRENLTREMIEKLTINLQDQIVLTKVDKSVTSKNLLRQTKKKKLITQGMMKSKKQMKQRNLLVEVVYLLEIFQMNLQKQNSKNCSMITVKYRKYI